MSPAPRFAISIPRPTSICSPSGPTTATASRSPASPAAACACPASLTAKASPGPSASPRVDTGQGREIWRANAGPGSVFRGITADHQFMWTAGDRIVFPWEAGGWTHLYSISANGGKPELLTPGRFEVEDVALSPGRRRGRLLLEPGRHRSPSSLEGLDQPAARLRPSPPAKASKPSRRRPPTGAIAFLRSDARRPLHVAIGDQDLDPSRRFPRPPTWSRRSRSSSPAPTASLFTASFPSAAAPCRPLPAIVFFHGGSRRQMLLGWHHMYYYSNAYALNQYLANPGYIVLSVNYRSGIGYGLNFREALNYGANGGSEYNDVLGAGLYLRSRPDVDPARIGVWGGSYGGYLDRHGPGPRLRHVRRRRRFPRRPRLGHRARTFPQAPPTTNWPSIRLRSPS